jgi:hypothetical protein
MIRFLLGATIGAAAMYWYLTGQIPWRDQVESWFARAASSYTAQEHRREADRVIGHAETPARR